MVPIFDRCLPTMTPLTQSTTDDYWRAISTKHKKIVHLLDDKDGVPVERAFRKLLKQMEFEVARQKDKDKDKFWEMMTIRLIERMLDQINE